MKNPFSIYTMERDHDDSGVSGTGHVGYAVVFPNGLCIVSFRMDLQTSSKSCTIYQSFEDAVKIHGHGGKTRFEPMPL